MYSADEQLISKTLAGDRDAFGLLVHKYQEMVFAYAFQKVRNEADAQDVTQEVFLRAFRNLYALRHPHRFRSWLYTIMSNECNRWLARAAKTRQREIMLSDAGDDKLQGDLAHAVFTDAWTDDLEQAISACPAATEVEVAERLIREKSLIYPIALDGSTKILGARGESFDRYAIGWGDPVILIDRKGEIANIAYPLNLQDRIQVLLAD